MDRDIRLYRKEINLQRNDVFEAFCDFAKKEVDELDNSKESKNRLKEQNTYKNKMAIRKAIKKLKDIIITK